MPRNTLLALPLFDSYDSYHPIYEYSVLGFITHTESHLIVLY